MAAVLVSPLSIASCLPPALGLRLQGAAPGTRSCSSSAHLQQLVAEGAISIVVADPSYDAGGCGDAMIAIRSAFPSVVVIAYLALEPRAMSHLMRVATYRLFEVVLFQYDDMSRRLADLLLRASAAPLETLMIAELEPELVRLPPFLREAVSDVYRTPRRFRVTADLAATAHTSRQTLHRRLTEAGLRSPRLLVGSGRVLRAASMLHDPGRTLRCVADHLGYHRPEQLSSTVTLLTGLRVRDIRAGVDGRVITRAIAGRLRSTGGDVALASD
jgi:AraC-like DNA-binding protein